MRSVVIIGGGISGLAAAHRLLALSKETGERIHLTLLEASPRLGGVIRSEQRDGFLIESGPDAFISEKPQAIELAKRIGLTSHLIETNQDHRRSFIVRKGKLRPVPAGFHLLAPARLWPFLTSDFLSLAGKARMALEHFIPRAELMNGVDDESLASFVRRRLGREALERVAQPMIGGIYTADPERLSLRATMPRFMEMEREHGSLLRAMRRRGDAGTSGARYSLFLSFDDGMQLLVDRLAERIAEGGSRNSDSEQGFAAIIKLNTAVESLSLAPANSETGAIGLNPAPAWSVRTDRNETLIADAVCLALPAYACARLLQGVDSRLAAELDAIPYASTATINLAYQRADIPHALDGFGFVVPFVEKRSLLACTFSSVKFAGRAPKGQALLRGFLGGALQPENFELDEDELVQRTREDLRALLGIEKRPLFVQVEKWPRSMPQYNVGHLDRAKRIEARVAVLPGLALAGNALYGPGIPDCIRAGEAACERIVFPPGGADVH